MPRIFDNIELDLLPALRATLEVANRSDFCVGYSLQRLWLASGNVVVSNFNDRPGKLFDGLEHIRLAIVLLGKQREAPFAVHTTTYNKWLTEARGQLFSSLRHTEMEKLVRSASIPKVGSELEALLLRKVFASPKTLHHYVSGTARYPIYYTRKLSWFVQILDFIPEITDGRGCYRQPSELKEVRVSTVQQRNAFLCVLNSSLFYWLLTVWSDCRNLNKREVLGMRFTFDTVDCNSSAKLDKLAEELMNDFRINSKILEMNYKDWGTMKIQCIYPKCSKPIIDEVDEVLARHYGFTEEELDFIINYDIKYRVGRSAEENG